MKAQQLLDIIKPQNITFPLYLYREREKLNVDSALFIFLMYLVSKSDKFLFDPPTIMKELNIDKEEVMENISRLNDLGLISVDVIKNKDGIMEESISLDKFWNKVMTLMIDDINHNNQTTSVTNVYDKIQEEFGRILSPMEYEIIGAWINSDISEELIYEALKETVFNGVSNLRYMDKILYDWGKKGYKNKNDIERQRNKWHQEKEKKQESKSKREVFDYNWLEEDDE